MIRTEAGLLLERLLSHIRDWKGDCLRSLFCYNGESSDAAYDCACCITWPDDKLYTECGCICHARIEAMAQVSDLRLLFTTLRLQNMLPDFPESFDQEQALRHAGLSAGHFHFHNTNGKFSTYPRAVCSVCVPCDPPHPKILFDTMTGDQLGGVQSIEVQSSTPGETRGQSMEAKLYSPGGCCSFNVKAEDISPDRS